MSNVERGETFDLAPDDLPEGPKKKQKVTAAGTHVGLCVHCQFDCTGVKGTVCPECGSSLLMPRMEPDEEVEISEGAYVACVVVSLIGSVLLGIMLNTDYWHSDDVRETIFFLLAMVPVSIAWLWIATRMFADYDIRWVLTSLQVAMSEVVVLVLCVFVGSLMDLEFHALWPWNIVISVVVGFVLYNTVLKLDTTDAALVVVFQRAIGIGVFYGVASLV